jgi:hypothetical protein
MNESFQNIIENIHYITVWGEVYKLVKTLCNSIFSDCKDIPYILFCFNEKQIWAIINIKNKLNINPLFDHLKSGEICAESSNYESSDFSQIEFYPYNDRFDTLSISKSFSLFNPINENIVWPVFDCIEIEDNILSMLYSFSFSENAKLFNKINISDDNKATILFFSEKGDIQNSDINKKLFLFNKILSLIMKKTAIEKKANFYSDFFNNNRESFFIINKKGQVKSASDNLNLVINKKYIENDFRFLINQKEYKEFVSEISELYSLAFFDPAVEHRLQYDINLIDPNGIYENYILDVILINDSELIAKGVKVIIKKCCGKYKKADKEHKMNQIKTIFNETLVENIQNYFDEKNLIFTLFFSKLKLIFKIDRILMIEFNRIEDIYNYYCSEHDDYGQCNIPKKNFNKVIDRVSLFFEKEKMFDSCKSCVDLNNKSINELIDLFDMRFSGFEIDTLEKNAFLLPLFIDNRLQGILIFKGNCNKIDLIKNEIIIDEINLCVSLLFKLNRFFGKPIYFKAPDFYEYGKHIDKKSGILDYLKFLQSLIDGEFYMVDKNLVENFFVNDKGSIENNVFSLWKSKNDYFSAIQKDKRLSGILKEDVESVTNKKKIIHQIQNICINNETKFLKIAVFPISNFLNITSFDSNITGKAMLYIRDISEQYSNIEKDMKIEFVENILSVLNEVGHDLNNYFTVINGNLSLLSSNPDASKTSDRTIVKLERIKRAVTKCRALTEKLFETYFSGKVFDSKEDIITLTIKAIVRNYNKISSLFRVRPFISNEFISIEDIIDNIAIYNGESYILSGNLSRFKKFLTLLIDEALFKSDSSEVWFDFRNEKNQSDKTNYESGYFQIKISSKKGRLLFPLDKRTKQSGVFDIESKGNTDYYIDSILNEFKGKIFYEETCELNIFTILLPKGIDEKNFRSEIFFNSNKQTNFLNNKNQKNSMLESHQNEIEIKEKNKNKIEMLDDKKIENETNFLISQKNLKIVVLDDSQEITEIIDQILRMINIKSKIFNSYSKLESWLSKKGKINTSKYVPVFLIDLSVIKKKNFSEISELVKKKFSFSKIYAFTGKRPDIQDLKNKGFDGVLPKPVDYKIIKEFINDILKSHNP